MDTKLGKNVLGIVFFVPFVPFVVRKQRDLNAYKKISGG